MLAFSASQKSRGGARQCVENRLKIEGRAADELQDVGRRGLLLQRLGEVTGLGLHLLEHARVLDRDRRLIGKGLQKCLFAVGERPRRPADHDDGAKAAVLPQHWRIEERCAPMAVHPIAQRRGQIGDGAEIGNVVRAAFAEDPAGHAFGKRSDILPGFLGPRAAPRDRPHHVVVADRIDAHFLAAEEALAGVEDGVEHRRRIRDGLADRPQHVRRRGLLLQRFVQIPSARFDLGFERLVALLDPLRHLVEANGERFDLVAGADVEPFR